MRNTIYWFSGTGNSLYAAKLLAERVGDTELVNMRHRIPASRMVPVGGEGHSIGFVFPSYYGNLPRLVRTYIEELNILPGTDLFTVVTMGAFGQGAIRALDALLKTKGLSLRYGTGLRMPANYIISYDPALFGAHDANRVDAKLKKTMQRAWKIADDIIYLSRRVQKNLISTKTLYKNIEALDAGFTIADPAKCTGCGLCKQVCPVGNIQIVDGEPVWQHHCEHCVACISWCTSGAIEYGPMTAARTRYHNPLVDVDELKE